MVCLIYNGSFENFTSRMNDIKSLKVIIVIVVCPSLNGRSLEITMIVTLSGRSLEITMIVHLNGRSLEITMIVPLKARL